MHDELSASSQLDTTNMEQLPKAKCDTCSTTFGDIDELAIHKLSHGASGTPNMADGSFEEAESEDLSEEQRNDRSNAISNRAELDNYRDDSECEVNPDQTPKQTKTIRPIDYV